MMPAPGVNGRCVDGGSMHRSACDRGTAAARQMMQAPARVLALADLLRLGFARIERVGAHVRSKAQLRQSQTGKKSKSQTKSAHTLLGHPACFPRIPDYLTRSRTRNQPEEARFACSTRLPNNTGLVCLPQRQTLDFLKH